MKYSIWHDIISNDNSNKYAIVYLTIVYGYDRIELKVLYIESAKQ